MSSAEPESFPAGPAEPEAAQPRAEELYGQLLRLKAEFENFRKRVDRERPEWVRLGEAGLLQRLLPLHDTLLQAHEALRRGPAEGGAGVAAGVELLFKEFGRLFDAEGVEPIEAVGKPYHHDLHEALGAVETDEQPEGTVVEELQKGYLLRGKVLRPARVRIAKNKGGPRNTGALGV